jgi:hypothetical protein
MESPSAVHLSEQIGPSVLTADPTAVSESDVVVVASGRAAHPQVKRAIAAGRGQQVQLWS